MAYTCLGALASFFKTSLDYNRAMEHAKRKRVEWVGFEQ
jgi:hypothetical protein